MGPFAERARLIESENTSLLKAAQRFDLGSGLKGE